VADTKEIALLLAEGETAKAITLNGWLNERTNEGASIAARLVLWRTYFAHMEAAKRYLEIAKGAPGMQEGKRG
jgi:hypothetical protein